MNFSRYDVWKIFAGMAIGMWIWNDWPIALGGSIFTGFVYGWSTIYRPKPSHHVKQDVT